MGKGPDHEQCYFHVLGIINLQLKGTYGPAGRCPQIQRTNYNPIQH
jgi:hypothetical protein